MCTLDFETKIETDRLILRPPREGDAQSLAAYLDDYDIAKMLTVVPWPFTLEDAEAYVVFADGLDAARDRSFIIESRQHGLIGICGFHTPEGALYPEIGFWIARSALGAGLRQRSCVRGPFLGSGRVGQAGGGVGSLSR